MFDRFRAILHEGSIDKRVQYMIEGLFADRKSNFRETPGVLPELDLVDADDQITHEDVTLDEEYDVEEELSTCREVGDERNGVVALALCADVKQIYSSTTRTTSKTSRHTRVSRRRF